MTNFNWPLELDIVLNDSRDINGCKIYVTLHSRIDHFKVAVKATNDISKNGVDLSPVYIYRRGAMTKTFAGTNTSHNICKKRV